MLLEKKLRKLKRHAKKRFEERFSYSLSDEQLFEIEHCISSGESELVNWTKGEPGIYLVVWNSLTFHAVFDYKTKKIITFLTLQMEFKPHPEG